MINMEPFRQISFRGRVAYSVSCFENALIALNYDSNDWKIVLNYLWEFTSIQYLDNWNDVVVELIPENLLEFKTYEEEEFERLSRDEFITLYKLYQSVEDSINVLLRYIYNPGISHVYTIIEEYGEGSLLSLEVLINFMIENKFPLPNIEPFLKSSIVENRGWGNKFIGTELSKIL
ncbi:hypothetical protein [Lysinibacillus sp. NPDC056185]|uniref:hypothetical protein n=1 Tax=Lysinibacillus sp. NPDC056185 TaxID=3345739 RepID=UPI0039F13227